MLITTYLQLWERGPTGSSGFPAGWDGLRTGSGGFPIPRKQVPMRSEFTKKSRLEPAFEGILGELPHEGTADFIEESPHCDTANIAE